VERISLAKRYFDQHKDMKSSKEALASIEAMIKVFKSVFHHIVFVTHSACPALQKAIDVCLDEAGGVYRSCGKCIELDDKQEVQSMNPLPDSMVSLLKSIGDCLGATSPFLRSQIAFS
jgi:hypothetical protein